VWFVDVVPTGGRFGSKTTYASCMALEEPSLRWAARDTLLLTAKEGRIEMLNSPAILREKSGRMDTVQVVVRFERVTGRQ
jgi:hypothetical protein